MSKPGYRDEAQNLLIYFKFDHLRSDLQPISIRFHGIANEVFNTLPDSRQKVITIEKLLEARDSALRSAL
jgi:hypothetical protein